MSTAMNALTPHLALLSSITIVVGAAMVRLGIGRGRLEARQPRRRCPSCGRIVQASVCRACSV